MSDSTLGALVHRIDTEPMTPEDRWALSVTAEELAEATGDREGLYQVRMRQVGFGHDVWEAEGVLARFMWCASMNDSDPARFPVKPDSRYPDIDLLWWYKWLVGMLFAWPQYSLRQIRLALDMMDAAYAREGAGQGGPRWARLHYTLEVEGPDEVREALTSIRSMPEDAYSHCPACASATMVAARMELGETSLALSLFDELMQRGDMCGSEPQSIVTEMLIPLLRAGRIIEALGYQQVAYEEILHMPHSLRLTTEHMLFFLVTGNPEYAYALLRRHLPDVWHPGSSPAHTMSGLTRLTRVCAALERAGLGDRPLDGTQSPQARALLGARPADADQAPTDPLTISEFLPLAHAAALPLAAQFDARDSTTRHTDAVKNALTEELNEIPVDLGGR